MIFAVYADGRYVGVWSATDAEDAIAQAKRARTRAELPPPSTWRATQLGMYRGPRYRGEPDDVAEQRLDFARENLEESENE